MRHCHRKGAIIVDNKQSLFGEIWHKITVTSSLRIDPATIHSPRFQSWGYDLLAHNSFSYPADLRLCIGQPRSHVVGNIYPLVIDGLFTSRGCQQSVAANPSTLSLSLSIIIAYLSSFAYSQALSMDYQHLQQKLVYLAYSASLQVLNFHLVTAKDTPGLFDLDQESVRKISEKVHRFLPIAHISQNKDAAYLEVVCDAALVVADKYDINKRWFYAAAQGMASMAIVPSLYESASDPIPLSNYHELLYEGSDADDDDAEDDAESHAVDDAKVAAEHDNDQGHEERSTQPPRSSMQHAAPPRKWTDTDIRHLVDLKIAGESWEAIAARFGRSIGALSTKWTHLRKPNSGWDDYIAKKKGEASGGLSALAEQPEEGEGNEMDVDEEAVEEVQPAASASQTRIRGWSDTEIRELIRHKVNGLNTLEIVGRMGRDPKLINSLWLKLSTHPNSGWLNYIHEQYRARDEREEQGKASQDAVGADAGARGQPSSVSLLPST